MLLTVLIVLESKFVVFRFSSFLSEKFGILFFCCIGRILMMEDSRLLFSELEDFDEDMCFSVGDVVFKI